MNKIQNSISIIKNAEQLSLKYNSDGFHLAFSGGKDSQVIYELCKLSGVKFKAYFYKTSVDPPSLLSFIRVNYPEVIWLYPSMSMYQLILKRGMLPLRQARFCCEYLKERNGLNSVVITGITKAESSKRKKRQVFEASCKLGSDKILLNPILEWTLSDVFSFLKDRNIKLCSIYDTRSRVGCVGCPMSPRSMRKDFINMPNFKKAYINTVKKLIIEQGKYKEFSDAVDVVNWWSSGLSRSVYLANKLQLKINF